MRSGGQSGRSSHAPRPGGHVPLRDLEQAVARLVTGGASNQETAVELFISVTAVQDHLTHIYARRGIRSRSEFAALLPEGLGMASGSGKKRGNGSRIN
ncbi:helix-turn-helix domain-containing protein [Streptomyces chartreusis]|uniref:helix-turn-helix domain-containing protein n=1 Tax=Streptomyces chartreusis TaxID=1969 RepID=UPI002101A143|nr:helix-turn-helix transcriptional regulator [Streptomyces chartreusis]